MLDDDLKTKYPEKYTKFLEVHTLPIYAMKLLFVKKLRRHGSVTLHLIGIDNSAILETFTFVLANRKQREGETLLGDMKFESIYDAWSWYEKKLIDLF